MATCKDCGAHIEWRQHASGAWIPFNYEDIELNDEFDSSIRNHFDTCCKPKEKPLTIAQRTRPGYL